MKKPKRKFTVMRYCVVSVNPWDDPYPYTHTISAGREGAKHKFRKAYPGATFGKYVHIVHVTISGEA